MWLIRSFLFSLYSILIALLVLILSPLDFRWKISFVLLRIWTNGVLFLFGVKVKIDGRENITSHDGKVYISNHLSYLDIFVLLAKIPDNVRMIYKKELNKMFFISWAMRACGFVPIDRENVRNALKALDIAAEKIKKGLSFLIFPEGTRSKDGNVQDFKRGMFLLTEKAKVDIVPVAIKNTNNLMAWNSLRIKPGTVNLFIGKPMKYKNKKEFLSEIREKVIKGMSNNDNV